MSTHIWATVPHPHAPSRTNASKDARPFDVVAWCGRLPMLRGTLPFLGQSESGPVLHGPSAASTQYAKRSPSA